MAQSVKPPTLGFSSGHDLRVLGSSPISESLLSGEYAWRFSLSLSLPPLACSCSLSIFQINKSFKKRKFKMRSLNYSNGSQRDKWIQASQLRPMEIK